MDITATKQYRLNKINEDSNECYLNLSKYRKEDVEQYNYVMTKIYPTLLSFAIKVTFPIYIEESKEILERLNKTKLLCLENIYIPEKRLFSAVGRHKI